MFSRDNDDDDNISIRCSSYPGLNYDFEAFYRQRNETEDQNIMQLPKLPQSKAGWKAALSTNSSQEKSSQWINKDLAPTPKEDRSWSWYGF